MKTEKISQLEKQTENAMNGSTLDDISLVNSEGSIFAQNSNSQGDKLIKQEKKTFDRMLKDLDSVSTMTSEYLNSMDKDIDHIQIEKKELDKSALDVKSLIK